MIMPFSIILPEGAFRFLAKVNPARRRS